MYALQPADFELATGSIVLLIVLAAILQDDVTCTTVGLFAPTEHLSLPVAIFACALGTLLGDLIWFMLGRWFGPPVLARPPMKWLVKPDQIDRAGAFIDRYHSSSIFVCRFLPGIRVSLQFVIGTLHPSIGRALGAFSVAALTYTLLVIGFCRLFRKTIRGLGFYEDYGTVLLAVAAVTVMFLLWVGKRTIERMAGTKTNDADP